MTYDHASLNWQIICGLSIDSHETNKLILPALWLSYKRIIALQRLCGVGIRW